MAVVVKSLRALDNELTEVAPKRTLPTWYAGDPDHKLRPSGHNADDTKGSKSEDSDADNIAEIRAGDYRLPLNAKFTAERLIQYLVTECRAKRITWIKYIIFNRRIWSASSGWVPRKYTGSNPHDHHFHISSKPDTASENSTKKVGLTSLLPKPTPKPPAAGAIPKHANGSRVNSASKNNVGTDVATLQRFIGEKQAGPADGRWDAKTTAGVKWYQREVLGLTGRDVDGIAGPKTWGPILKAI